jgi:hypothetical protein
VFSTGARPCIGTTQIRSQADITRQEFFPTSGVHRASVPRAHAHGTTSRVPKGSSLLVEGSIAASIRCISAIGVFPMPTEMPLLGLAWPRIIIMPPFWTGTPGELRGAMAAPAGPERVKWAMVVPQSATKPALANSLAIQEGVVRIDTDAAEVPRPPGRRGVTLVPRPGLDQHECLHRPIGATDRRGEQPIDRRVGVGDFLATVYRHVAIDAERIAIRDSAGRPGRFSVKDRSFPNSRPRAVSADSVRQNGSAFPGR